jgi:lipopolysaccharide cholinephosphotransferase
MVKVTKKQHQDLYRQIKFIHDTFMAHGIRYSIFAGTLMGAVRHGGIIPWDDDGDMVIFAEDVPKLRTLVKTFKSGGYTLAEGKKPACSKVPNSCTWIVSGPSADSLNTDLFVFDQGKDGRYTFISPEWIPAPNGGQKCYFDKGNLFPLVPMAFGNFMVYGPRNYVWYLNRCYGANWDSHRRQIYDHINGKWIDSAPVEMKAADFKPAEPPVDTCDTTVPPVVWTCGASHKPSSSKIVPLTKSGFQTEGDLLKLQMADLRAILRELKIKAPARPSKLQLIELIVKTR